MKGESKVKKITVALAAMLIISLICIGCSQGNVNEASSKEDSSVFSELFSNTSSVTTEESETVSSDTVTSMEEESSAQSEPVSSLPPVSSEAPMSSEELTSSASASVSEPSAPSESPVSSEYDFANVTYESYNKMSAEEQYAFILTFESPADFALWYHEEKAKYDAEHPPIEIGPGGNIDLSSIGGSR